MTEGVLYTLLLYLWIRLTCFPEQWKQFSVPEGTQQSFIRGGSALRFNPLPFYIPCLAEKVPL